MRRRRRWVRSRNSQGQASGSEVAPRICFALRRATSIATRVPVVTDQPLPEHGAVASCKRPAKTSSVNQGGRCGDQFVAVLLRKTIGFSSCCLARESRVKGGFHEKTLGCRTRSRDTCHGPFMGGYACVRVRRLRSEPPSRSLGRLPLGWSKSSLVPETHRSCRGLWSPWDAVVLRQGARLPRRPTRGRRPNPHL